MDGVRHLSMGSWEKMVEKVNFMRCVQKYDKFRAHRKMGINQGINCG